MLGTAAIALIAPPVALALDFIQAPFPAAQQRSPRFKLCVLLLALGFGMPLAVLLVFLIDPVSIKSWLQSEEVRYATIPYSILIALLIIGSFMSDKSESELEDRMSG